MWPGLCLQDTYVEQEPRESANDRNDRAIRVATQWYAGRVTSIPTILVTDDADNRRKALASDLHCLSVQEYASTKVSDQDILDVVQRCAHTPAGCTHSCPAHTVLRRVSALFLTRRPASSAAPDMSVDLPVNRPRR